MTATCTIEDTVHFMIPQIILCDSNITHFYCFTNYYIQKMLICLYVMPHHDMSSNDSLQFPIFCLLSTILVPLQFFLIFLILLFHSFPQIFQVRYSLFSTASLAFNVPLSGSTISLVFYWLLASFFMVYYYYYSPQNFVSCHRFCPWYSQYLLVENVQSKVKRRASNLNLLW